MKNLSMVFIFLILLMSANFGHSFQRTLSEIYTTKSGMNGKSPVVIYLAIDSPEPFMQITIDHEIYNLKKLCVSEPKTKAVILVSSQLSSVNQGTDVPKITYCNGGKIYTQKIVSSAVLELIRGTKSPLINKDVLGKILEFVTGSSLPFSGEGFFIQLKSHGFLDAVALFLDKNNMKSRLVFQDQILAQYGIGWPSATGLNFGEGTYERAFEVLKDTLGSTNQGQLKNGGLGMRRDLSSDEQEFYKAPKLTEGDLSEIINDLEKKGRKIAFTFVESCRGTYLGDGEKTEDSRRHLKLAGDATYRANGSLNYHNFDWSEFRNKIGNGGDLFFALIAKTHEIQNGFPDDDLFDDILKNNLTSFKTRIAHGEGLTAKHFANKPLIWLLFKLQRYSFIDALVASNPNYVADLLHKSQYDLLYDLFYDFSKSEIIPKDQILRVIRFQKREHLAKEVVINMDDFFILQLLFSDRFSKESEGNREILTSLLIENGISNSTDFLVKPLKTLDALHLNLLELCLLRQCYPSVNKILNSLGFQIRKTEDAKWAWLLQSLHPLRETKEVLATLSPGATVEQITEFVGQLTFDPLNTGSVLDAHDNYKYFVGELNIEFKNIPFGQRGKWTDVQVKNYFRDLEFYFSENAKGFDLDPGLIRQMLRSRAEEILPTAELTDPDGFWGDQSDQDPSDNDLFYKFGIPHIRDAFLASEIDPISQFRCNAENRDQVAKCEIILKALADLFRTEERALRKEISQNTGLNSLSPKILGLKRDRFQFLEKLKDTLKLKGSTYTSGNESDYSRWDGIEPEVVIMEYVKGGSKDQKALFEYLDWQVEKGYFQDIRQGLLPDVGSASSMLLQFVLSGHNRSINYYLSRPDFYRWLPQTGESLKFLIESPHKYLSPGDQFKAMTIFIERLQRPSIIKTRYFSPLSKEDKKLLSGAYIKLALNLNRISNEKFKLLNWLQKLKGSQLSSVGLLGTPDKVDLLNLILCKTDDLGKLGEVENSDYLDRESSILQELLKGSAAKGNLQKLDIGEAMPMGALSEMAFSCLFDDTRVKTLLKGRSFSTPQEGIQSAKRLLLTQGQVNSSYTGLELVQNELEETQFTMKVYDQLVAKAKIIIKYDPLLLTMRDEKGWTFLHWASYSGNWPMLKALLEAGANPNQVDNEGKTILDLFFEGKNLSYDVLLLFRNHGFHFHKKDQKKGTMQYLNYLKSIPLAEVETLSIVEPYEEKYAPRSEPSSVPILNILNLGAKARDHYYRSGVFLRQFQNSDQ